MLQISESMTAELDTSDATTDITIKYILRYLCEELSPIMLRPGNRHFLEIKPYQTLVKQSLLGTKFRLQVSKSSLIERKTKGNNIAGVSTSEHIVYSLLGNKFGKKVSDCVVIDNLTGNDVVL